MEGFILIADLLGFSALVNNTEIKEQNNKIAEWISFIEKLCLKYQFDKYQLISDTVFIASDINKDSLTKLISFSKDLIEEGLAKYFLIRGAITQGEIIWGKLTYGKAVISSHRIESIQKWIGITVSIDHQYINEAFKNNFLICYPVPTTNNEYKLYSVINWNVPSFKELLSKMTSHYYIKTGQVIPSDIIEKAQNTALYGLYVRHIKKNNLSNTRFHYFHPFEIIDEY